MRGPSIRTALFRFHRPSGLSFRRCVCCPSYVANGRPASVRFPWLTLSWILFFPVCTALCAQHANVLGRFPCGRSRRPWSYSSWTPDRTSPVDKQSTEWGRNLNYASPDATDVPMSDHMSRCSGSACVLSPGQACRGIFCAGQIGSDLGLGSSGALIPPGRRIQKGRQTVSTKVSATNTHLCAQTIRRPASESSVQIRLASPAGNFRDRTLPIRDPAVLPHTQPVERSLARWSLSTPELLGDSRERGREQVPWYGSSGKRQPMLRANGRSQTSGCGTWMLLEMIAPVSPDRYLSQRYNSGHDSFSESSSSLTPRPIFAVPFTEVPSPNPSGSPSEGTRTPRPPQSCSRPLSTTVGSPHTNSPPLFGQTTSGLSVFSRGQ